MVLPVYTMQRDEANYEYPDEFIPERWYSRPELIRRREVFLTWNIGKHEVAPFKPPFATRGKPLLTPWTQV